MDLFFQRRTYRIRSRGLFQFLQLLREVYPDWVDIAGIQARMPSVSSRQLARFIDMLENSGMALVRYETKTRGRYQLTVAPESIALQGGFQFWDKNISPHLAPEHSAEPPPCASLEVYQDRNWIVWVVALLHSTLASQCSQFLGEDGTLDHLEKAEVATATLPPWTRSVVQTLRAHALVKTSQHREATFWLRRVETALRHGFAHPATASAVKLIRAKMHFNQRRYDEMERLVNAPLTPQQSPHWLNMKALLAGQKALSANEDEVHSLLVETLSATAEALGYVFLWQGDSSLLDCLLYNFANNLLSAVNRGLLPTACADTVLQWLAAQMLACRKLGIGDHSIMASLLSIDVALAHGLSVDHWPPLLRQNLSNDLEEVLNQAVAQSRRAENRLEIAQCLRRQVRLAASPGKARPAYFEALALFADLGHEDALSQLRNDWRIRFGISPPG